MLRQRYPDQDPALARARAADLLTPWYRYYLKFDPQPGLAGVQCPVLLLNGTDDDRGERRHQPDGPQKSLQRQ